MVMEVVYRPSKQNPVLPTSRTRDQRSQNTCIELMLDSGILLATFVVYTSCFELVF